MRIEEMEGEVVRGRGRLTCGPGWGKGRGCLATCAHARGNVGGARPVGKRWAGRAVVFLLFLCFPLKFCIWMHNQSNGQPI